MSTADDLIERLEAETDQRIDDADGDNLAMAGLLGAMSRMLGQSPPAYRDRDDVAAGLLIKKLRMSPEYKQEQEAKQLIAKLLASEISPNDIKNLMG